PLLREACLLRAGRYAEAEAMAAAWRARIPSEGPRELRLTHASHLLHEGLAALEAGDAERAAARLEGIEPLMRGDPAFVVVPLAHLAEARRRLGALDEAERCARRALAYAEESDSAGLSPAGLARVALGAVALDRDQPERALEEALAGVERLELLFDVAYLVRGAEVLARARMACGAEAEAIEGLDDFLLLLEGTDMRPAIGHLQALRGELARPGHTERPPGSESLAVTVEPLATYEALTSRELEVLKLAAEGGSNRDIAKALFVSVGTVKTHMHRILAKLDVPNRTRAIHRARRAGLL
ncbi:MAG: hypothetical protein KC457_28970, partial [Myxococcales bacterium]|nr:hypothetical protein [Myxococcales bacterium]